MEDWRNVRVLITGAGGQLAADLRAACAAAGYTVHAPRRAELDIADEEAVQSALDALRPELILNAAAYNRVDDAEAHPALAYAINALGPRLLARGAATLGATLVHYSTDYVVGGDRATPYHEDDPPAPRSAYATAKLAGEFFVRALVPRHYVLRVCGLFGLAGRSTRQGNFVETMLRAADAGRPLRVVTDQVVAPTSTADVARVTLDLVHRQAPYGLYHCTGRGETSWYDFARAIFEQAGLRPDLQPITALDYGAPALRPAYSILDNAKLGAAGVRRPAHWRDSLSVYLDARARDQAPAGKVGAV